MTTGQTRVLVLLMLLVALEAIRIKAVHDFIVGIIQAIGNGINLASAGAPPGPSIAQQEKSAPDKNGNCPPGSVLLNGVCYNVKGV